MQRKPLARYQTERVFSSYLRRGAVSGVAAPSHLITSSVKRSSAAETPTQENSSALLPTTRHPLMEESEAVPSTRRLQLL